MSIQSIQLRKNPKCKICGESPEILTLQDTQFFCDIHDQENLPLPEWGWNVKQLNDKKMKNEIIKYYKTAKGTMKTKCFEIAKMINVEVHFCTREYLERSRQKNVNGCTDGNEILLINLKDKYDLFLKKKLDAEAKVNEERAAAQNARNAALAKEAADQAAARAAERAAEKAASEAPAAVEIAPEVTEAPAAVEAPVAEEAPAAEEAPEKGAES